MVPPRAGRLLDVLRRIVINLRRQDWTTVGVELVVVILGVFIGVQASNWNEARTADNESKVFTDRLKSDLRAEAFAYELSVAYYGQVLANARRAEAALSGRSEMGDEALLAAAYRATQYVTNNRHRTTWDELGSTGNIGLIRDPGLRQLAADVYTDTNNEWLVDDARRSPYRLEFRKLLDIPVQDALATACGDHTGEDGDYASLAGYLDYPCDPELTPEAAAAAVHALQADPNLLPLLRLQITTVDTNLGGLDSTNNIQLRQRLQAFAGTTR